MQTTSKNSNWGHRRTTTERCFILVSALVFILPALQMAEGYKISKKTSINVIRWHDFESWATDAKIPVNKKEISVDSTPRDICYKEECINTASAVLRKMKQEVNPCEDFYQFACGKYIDETEIPKDKARVSTFSVVSDTLFEQLKAIVAEKRPESDPKHLKLPNILYNACMNKTLGVQPIQDISESLGGWPVVVGNTWDSNKTWTWQETVKQFRRLGFSQDYILGFSVKIDLKNNTKYIIELNQPSVGLNLIYLLKGFNETLFSAYYDYMVDIAELFGATKESALNELRESLQFQMDLAKISLSAEKARNISDLYNLRTIKELKETYPYVDWLDYINALLPEGLNVDENEVVNLVVPTFLIDLGKLLNRTENRVIANYMMWRIHKYSVDFLPEKFRQKKFKFSAVASGKKEEVARWKECTNIASYKMDYATGSLFVRKHFKGESKSNALEMVGGLRAAFSQILDETDWMDQKTKQEAKRKLQAIVTHIGYADALLDNDKLEEYYRKIEFYEDKYMQSGLNLIKFYIDRSFEKLKLPVNKADWKLLKIPHVVNALYDPQRNIIEFPAGILQGHFFHAERPKYMNYGAIGVVIGHELTHGFDDIGRKFDANGNLVDWWESDAKNAFLEKAKCIIDQYSNFTNSQTGLKLNGIITQGENIADNGGVRIAYKAYRQWVAKNGKEEPIMPGLSYGPNQMFWISFAQTWFAKATRESLKRSITTGKHSSAEYRVLGSLQNNEDFSNDFHCRKGTPMNPVHKCKVW